DDGPYEYTSELINLLDREGVKATFFVNGQNFWDLETNTDAQDVIRKAYMDGHQIASHTWSHAALDELEDSAFDEQIDKLE
ncbi:carbohydrate esterase family 4 protein, partial [Backusella circina FSU 941]